MTAERDRQPVSERLSALHTPLTKFGAPILTGGVFATIVAEMLRHPERIDWFGGTLPWWAPWATGLLGLATAVFFGLVIAPLKRVALEGDELIISNYRRSIRVPLTAIAEVGYVKRVMVDDRPVVAIRFLGPSDFGEQITFIPTDEHVLTKIERCRQLAQQRPGSRRGRPLPS